MRGERERQRDRERELKVRACLWEQGEERGDNELDQRTVVSGYQCLIKTDRFEDFSIFFFFLSNMDSLVRVIRRDVASAIKELLNTVNTVLRKYQHQNRRVSGYISKFKKKKKCLCAQTQLLWNKWSWKAVCIYWLGSGTAEERVCEILQELQWHSQNLLQRWKVRHCF